MFEDTMGMELYKTLLSVGRLNHNLELNNTISATRNDSTGDIGVDSLDLFYAIELLDGESREVIDI